MCRLRPVFTFLACLGAGALLAACGGGAADEPDSVAAATDARRTILAISSDGTDRLTGFDAGEWVEATTDPQLDRLSGIAALPSLVDPGNGQTVRRDPGPLTVQYEGGDTTQRWARIDADPVDPANRVLWFGLRKANVTEPDSKSTKGRVQVNAYGVEQVRAAEVSMRLRLYITRDLDLLQSLPETFDWLTLSEWWNNAGWTGQDSPFRISMNIVKTSAVRGSPLLFAAKAQTRDPATDTWGAPVWERVNRQVTVPTERWVTLEYFFREGKSRTGRFFVALTVDGGPRQVLFDVTGWTRHPSDPAPDGLTHFNPMKMYTSATVIDHIRRAGGTLQMAWDDLSFRFCDAAPAGTRSACAPDGVD